MNDLLLKIADEHEDDVVTVSTFVGPGPGDEGWTPEMWSDPTWWATYRIGVSDGAEWAVTDWRGEASDGAS
jgi:hypothetical protein